MDGSSALLEGQFEFYAEVLRKKYCKGSERTADEVFQRVSKGLVQSEAEVDRPRLEELFLTTMRSGFYPAGRIASACGTEINATLINCFVQPVGDSTSTDEIPGKPGIFIAQSEAAETMRRGGGVGYNFSRLRPKGARVKGTQSRSSGPISYMRVFDRACETVESAGARRGAQMGILRIDHPDIEQFIGAKDIRQQAARLRTAGFDGSELQEMLQGLRTLSNFNISVAVTDEFMQCVVDDRDFQLVHKAEPDPSEIEGAFLRPDGLWVYRTVKARDLWDKVMRTTFETADPGIVFITRMNADNNLYYCEEIEATNPCGEQPLPDYGCCCLGSINLAEFVDNAFSDRASFDFRRLRKVVTTAVRMLDNVLDITFWPLEQQRREAHNKRRIGLGFTGLASAMAMAGLRYGSELAEKFATQVAKEMRDTAYRASVGLAKERGAFPLFDADKYLASGFASRLPDTIKEEIRRHGIRNSHLLSIAPTGTISLAFGQNVSGGIEPPFAWKYDRTVRADNGSSNKYEVQDYGYRKFIQQGGDPKHLPDHFVNSQTLAPEDHLRIQAAVQPYVDTSISKTVNCPADIAFEAFQGLYMSAWKLGLKGCTTFRPNDVTGSVLTVKSEKAEDPALSATHDESDPDRRVRINTLPTLPLSSLRWTGRPLCRKGNPAMTYMVEDGDTSFAVFVGHIVNGKNHPFEAWVNGSEQPRGLGGTAKLLSMDMRSSDHGWLLRKLDALLKTKGTPIKVAMPDSEEDLVYGSPTAALAALVKYRCKELGVFDDIGETPVLNALMSPKEPKTGSGGTMSWSVDVRNYATGDRFVLTLKELLLPESADGSGTTWSRRPYSVWLSGDYPRDLDGLCKMLSFDMRIIDPAWIGEKLRRLLNYKEAGAAFMAPFPGTDKHFTFPSTESYMAALILYRFKVLGILNMDGTSQRPMGLLESKDKAMGFVLAPPATPRVLGKLCPDCGVHAVAKSGGCEQCTNCGYVGSCG